MSELLKWFNENLGRFKACRQWRKILSWVLLLFINNLIKEYRNQPSTSGLKRGVFFPLKIASVSLKSTSAFHLPVLWLGLKTPNLLQNAKPKIMFTSQGFFACFPSSWIALKSFVINDFLGISDCVVYLYLNMSKVNDVWRKMGQGGTHQTEKPSNSLNTCTKCSLGTYFVASSMKLNNPGDKGYRHWH